MKLTETGFTGFTGLRPGKIGLKKQIIHRVLKNPVNPVSVLFVRPRYSLTMRGQAKYLLFHPILKFFAFFRGERGA